MPCGSTTWARYKGYFVNTKCILCVTFKNALLYAITSIDWFSYDRTQEYQNFRHQIHVLNADWFYLEKNMSDCILHDHLTCIWYRLLIFATVLFFTIPALLYVYYNLNDVYILDITPWACYLKSLALWLFMEQLVQSNNKEQINGSPLLACFVSGIHLIDGFPQQLASKGKAWASCQIRKIAGYAYAGNAGNVFPATMG